MKSKAEGSPAASVPLCDAVHPNGAKCALPAGHFPATNHRPLSEHHCHARGCLAPTKPEMLMCLRHWRRVPRDLQRAVWATYRQGQCDDKRPSQDWHDAADAAIAAVARKEGTRLKGAPSIASDPSPSEGAAPHATERGEQK